MRKLSKMDEEAVSTIAHESAPKLLKHFKRYHDQSVVGSDLLEIFKMWTNYDKCKVIFCNNYTPFALEIVRNYFIMTNSKISKEDEEYSKNQKDTFRALDVGDSLIDSSILQHSLDIL